MPRRSDNTHTNPEINPDANHENIINDPKAFNMGVAVSNFYPGHGMSKNPYHVKDTEDTPAEMEQFEKLTRGKGLLEK